MDTGRQPPTPRPAHFSLWDTVAIIVGIIIGTGIFKAPGSIFALSSGPWEALGIWVLGGLLCVVGAFCFAELASTYPRSGGEYVYLTRAFGPWAGFLFAWAQLLIVRTGASIVVMAYVFADYAAKLARLDETGENFPVYYTLLALLPIGALVGINIVGVRWGKWTQNGLTAVKVLGLVGVLVAGLVWGAVREPGQSYDAVQGTVSWAGAGRIQLDDGRTFALASDAKVTRNGDKKALADVTGLQAKVLVADNGQAVAVKATTHGPFGALTLALILVLWTYAGWHEGAYVAAEVKDKRRNLPRALLLGTAAVIVLYLLVNAAYIVGMGYEEAASSKVVAADLLQRALGPFGEVAMCLLVILSSLGAINGMLCTNARVFAEFGNDHSLFAPLGRWHVRLGTPVAALLVQLAVCVITILAVALAIQSTESFERLIGGTAPVFWVFFFATGVALFALRRQDRGIDRPFTTPLYPVAPLLYCGCCALMVVGSVVESPADAAVWTGIMLLGVPLYWLSRHTPRTFAAMSPPELPKVPTAMAK